MGVPGRNGTDGRKVSLHMTVKSNVQIYVHYIDTTQPSLENLQGKIGRIGAPGCKGDPGDKVSLFTCCIACVQVQKVCLESDHNQGPILFNS